MHVHRCVIAIWIVLGVSTAAPGQDAAPRTPEVEPQRLGELALPARERADPMLLEMFAADELLRAGDPLGPAEVFGIFMQVQPGWPGQHDELKGLIRANPRPYVPLISEAMRIPTRVEGLEAPAGDLRARLVRQRRVLSHQLLQCLGRSGAEPILFRTFSDARPLFERCRLDGEAARFAWKARGGWERAKSIKHRAEAIIIGRREAYFSGMMSEVIGVATSLRPPVLVDSVLEFYEAGLEDYQSGWPEYVLKFAGEREDVLPRVQKLIDDPNTSHSVKWKFKRALDAFWKGVVEGREAEKPEVAQGEAAGSVAEPGRK